MKRTEIAQPASRFPETWARLLRAAAGVSPLEAKIDRLVYALHGLTEEEIAVVEGR